MRVLLALSCAILIALSLAGCGGNGGHHHEEPPPPEKKFTFSITEWTFPDGQTVKTQVPLDQKVHACTQFSLDVMCDGKETGIPIQDVKDIKFTKNGEPYEPFAWPDDTVGTFYRIDNPDFEAVYRIEGTLEKDGISHKITREFMLMPL